MGVTPVHAQAQEDTMQYVTTPDALMSRAVAVLIFCHWEDCDCVMWHHIQAFLQLTVRPVIFCDALLPAWWLLNYIRVRNASAYSDIFFKSLCSHTK